MTVYEKDFYAVLLESLGVVMFIIIIVFLTMVIFIGSLINPLRTINNAAGQIARGDLSVRIDKKYNDEIGELAATVNHMANELQKLDVMKTDFISAVSHELRTPLTSIRGWSETLMTAPPDEKELRLGLSVISKETERLSRMVGELLDFSRMESGRLTMNMNKVELVSILADVVRIFSVSFAEKKILLSQDIRVDSILLYCDADRIWQVIVNILDNVLKFCDEGGTVRIILQSKDGYAEMIIEDNGPGISPEDLPRVKEKFYKGKSTRPGSGIGLGICDEIIRLHNGILTISSEEGNGTQVKIRLPLSDN